MERGLPVALVIGSDRLGGRKLIEKLRQQEVIVKDGAENYDDQVDYIFDFEGGRDIWRKAAENGTKVTIVAINDKKEAEAWENDIKSINGDLRLVKAFGVYGPGMTGDSFMGKAFQSAVKNKNLILPSLSLKFRLLAEDDLVEAILRVNFLSGLERGVVLIAGEEIDSQQVAAVLIDEAKMTRNQVIQSEIQVESFSDKEVRENWARLHWQPQIEFRDGVKETLQYFFTQADEESRSSVINKSQRHRPTTPVKLTVEVEPSSFSTNESEEKEEENEEKESKTTETNEPKFEIKPIIKKTEVERDYPEEEIEELDEGPVVIKPDSYSLISPTGELLKVKQVKKKYWPRILIILAVISMLFWPVKWLSNLVLLKQTINRVEELIKIGQSTEAIKIINQRLTVIRKADEQINNWSLNRVSQIRHLQEIFRLGQSVLVIEEKAAEVGERMAKINQGLFGEAEVDWSKELSKLPRLLDELEIEIGLFEARFTGSSSWLPPKFKEAISYRLKDLNQNRDKIAAVKQLLPIIPTIIGIDGQRREYLVLLQNESELRPTGGFIGSFGILSFQNGKLLNFEVKDVYEADGQLEGHVEPPAEIRDYLGEASWFLRDANWQANFTGAAKDLEWFLEKEIGRKVDGVISVNLAVARAVLEVVGEITIPDFKEKINKDNLYDQAEYYAEAKFFPGSSQKASFLSALGEQLFESIKTLDTTKRGQLLIALIDKLDEKEVQLAFDDSSAAQGVAALGWDGSIKEGTCASGRCLADYTFINESNFGVNKVNYFIRRRVEKNIAIGSNLLSRDLKINYENMAKTINYPAGDYKNYLRVYLPREINLETVVIQDGAGNQIEVVDGEKLKLDEKYGKKEIGFLVIVPVSQKRIVRIKYNSPLALTDQFSYLDYLQRQSGSGETEWIESVAYPAEYQPIQVEPVATTIGNKVLFQVKLDRDLKIGVEISR